MFSSRRLAVTCLFTTLAACSSGGSSGAGATATNASSSATTGGAGGMSAASSSSSAAAGTGGAVLGTGGLGGAGAGASDAGEMDVAADALGKGGLHLGDQCGVSAASDAGMCGEGLACCYPCKNEMCDSLCAIACSASPACINGCVPML
jgi:hypothetical protein